MMMMMSDDDDDDDDDDGDGLNSNVLFSTIYSRLLLCYCHSEVQQLLSSFLNFDIDLQI